jgi:hypothetical protein
MEGVLIIHRGKMIPESNMPAVAPSAEQNRNDDFGRRVRGRQAAGILTTASVPFRLQRSGARPILRANPRCANIARRERPYIRARERPDAAMPLCCDAKSSCMTVYRLFKNKAFEPEVITVMTRAYTEVCRTLGLSDGDEPQTDAVAKKVIEFAQRGERDPVRLREHVLQALRR